MELQIYVKFLVGLFAIVNPVGLLPVFISLTDNLVQINALPSLILNDK